MSLFVGLLSFFVILGTLILVHELGHFTAAKLSGVQVDEFGIGFPPRILSRVRGSTVYSLNAIPLGGFVKMRGENGEDDEPDSFGAKPPWQRLVILCSGPGMNLLLAVVIFFFTFMRGAPQGLTDITAVQKGSPAAHAGLRAGDRIVAVNGHQVKYLGDLQQQTDSLLGHRVNLLVQRGSEEFSTSLTPRANPPKNQGPMGIVLDKTTVVSYSPAKAVSLSLSEVWAMVATIPIVVGSVTQHGGAGVTGPIGIAHLTTRVVHNEPSQGFGSILQFVALLSANLGVLNLLPIPALDGGRIVFVLLSWVRRRNLDPELEGVIHMVGMALLLLLIMFVSYHDIVRWVSGGSF